VGIDYEQIVPIVLIILDIISASLYAINGDVRHTIYWLSAAILTASVTF
jgi:hypothetical protein